MHELSIAISILDAVQEEVDTNGYGRVEAVHLRLGPLAGVVGEALRSAFELAAERTPLAKARLVIEDVPILIHCPGCNGSRPVRSVQALCCAECATPASRIVSGEELEIAALELA